MEPTEYINFAIISHALVSGLGLSISVYLVQLKFASVYKVLREMMR